MFVPLIIIASAVPSDISGIVAAIGGLILGIITTRRRSKTDKTRSDQENRTEVLEGYGQIVKDLQTEIERIRRQYLEDLDIWKEEKSHLENEKDILLKQLTILHDQIEKPPIKRRRKPTNDNEIT